MIALLRTTRKTAAVSSAPPKGRAGFFLPWRRAAAPIALLRKLWHEDEAQDMVEYAMLLRFIVLCAAIILTNTRTQVSAIWSTISSSLSSAVSDTAS